MLLNIFSPFYSINQVCFICIKKPIILHIMSHILLIIFIWQMLNKYHYIDRLIKNIKQVISRETKPGGENLAKRIFLIIQQYQNIEESAFNPYSKSTIFPFQKRSQNCHKEHELRLVRLCAVCPSECNNSAPIGRIFH